MNIEIDLGQLEAMAGRFLTASALMTPLLEASLRTFVGEMEYTAVGEMKASTPIGKPHPYKEGYTPGELQRKTLADTTVDGLLMETVVAQTAKSLPNQDGSGGGAYYGEFVRDGRDAITAPSSGPWSTGKQALLTPMGPRPAVGPARANPYPDEAYAPMVTATILLAARWGESGLEQLSARL